jgi:putative endopeptidase
LMLKNMDTLIRPGNNYDAYVNGPWQHNTVITAEKP